MARLIPALPTRGHSVAPWAGVAALAVALGAAGIALSRLSEPVVNAIRPAAASPAVAAPATGAQQSSAMATGAAPARQAVACPLQSVHIALAPAAAQPVCMAATLLQQNGSVRSYTVAAADADGWALRIDMVGRAVHAVSLRARDGRSYACQAPQCLGEVVIAALGAGRQGELALRGLRLMATAAAGRATSGGPAEAVLDGRLRLPADEQVPGLACTGARVMLSAPDGTAQAFCGQGGAGVEIADDGQRRYRFQDHEGRTLEVTVGGDQRVVGVDWQGLACAGSACIGASTSSASPGNDLAERSFFFGRTALFRRGAAGAAAAPVALIVDGTLVMPAQQ